MLEFNTDDDLHTVMLYKRHELRLSGYQGIVCVDIDSLAELHEQKCKMLAEIFLCSIGINFATNQ